MYREEWLDTAVDELRPLFEEAGEPVPAKVRVSVGWPGGRGPKREIIGQCWPVETVEDGAPAIFISPVLKDPVKTLDVLVHELVHAVGKSKHRKEFSDLAKKVGLEKPWRATNAGTDLKKKLVKIAKKLGVYEHSPIDQKHYKTQTTRLLKAWHPKCGYTIRITQKWVDVGLPECPCNKGPIQLA